MRPGSRRRETTDARPYVVPESCDPFGRFYNRIFGSTMPVSAAVFLAGVDRIIPGRHTDSTGAVRADPPLLTGHRANGEASERTQNRITAATPVPLCGGTSRRATHITQCAPPRVTSPLGGYSSWPDPRRSLRKIPRDTEGEDARAQPDRASLRRQAIRRTSGGWSALEHARHGGVHLGSRRVSGDRPMVDMAHQDSCIASFAARHARQAHERERARLRRR